MDTGFKELSVFREYWIDITRELNFQTSLGFFKILSEATKRFKFERFSVALGIKAIRINHERFDDKQRVNLVRFCFTD